MDKNEELQKWLNDDRYVQGKELANMWNIAAGSVQAYLKKNNVKIQKKIYLGPSGMFVFYSKQDCDNARLLESNKREELKKWMTDGNYVQLQDVKPRFEMSIGAIGSLLRKNNIIPAKTINASACIGMFTFYCKKKIENLLKTRDLLKKEVEELMRRPDCVQIQELSKIWGCSISAVRNFLSYNKIKPIRHIQIGGGTNNYVFYDRDNCLSMRLKRRQYYSECLIDHRIIQTKDLSLLWNLTIKDTGIFLSNRKIKAIKKIGTDGRGVVSFYDRAECERARPFINQPEQKEVEKVEEKQMELPEPKEQTPDIIPADTIDLFTMSELESELKNRGVELTAEVRAKINASDMSEMQHIATMLRGNTKTIAIRLSVLNEIAGQLRKDTLCIVEDSKISMNVHTNDGRIEKYYLNTKLRPCVLCGGDALAVDAEESKNDNWHASVLCCKCGDSSVCADDSNLHDVMDSLIDGWQERHHVGSAPKKKSRKGIGGAKSKYDENFPALAKEYARQGATDKSISEYLGISQDTFYRYCKEYPLFAKALLDGRDASPFNLNGLAGKSASERYLLLMQQQLNDMQKTIEMLVKKLDGVGVVEKKIYMKNNKVDKVIVTETKLK